MSFEFGLRLFLSVLAFSALCLSYLALKRKDRVAEVRWFLWAIVDLLLLNLLK